MKKTILITTLLILLIYINVPLIASGQDEQYAKILTDDVILYRNKTMSQADAMFEIPKGYYVTITEEGENYYGVSYGELGSIISKFDGFIKRSSHIRKSPVKEPPQYLNQQITTKQRALLHTVPQITQGFAELNATHNIYYVGKITNDSGNLFYLVTTEQYIGYAQAEFFDAFTIPTHPIPIETPKPDQPQAGEKTPPANNSGKVKTILVIAISIPALIILFLIFKPQKQ